MYWIFKEPENCNTELGEKSINTNRNNNDERLQSTELKPAIVCILYMFKRDFKKSMRTEIEDIKKKKSKQNVYRQKKYTQYLKNYYI